MESVAKRGDADRLVFESEAVLKRVKKHGDLFEPLLKAEAAAAEPPQIGCYLRDEADRIAARHGKPSNESHPTFGSYCLLLAFRDGIYRQRLHRW